MVLEKIVPVIVMLLIGVWCRRKQIISAEGINGLKTLATGFMLPVLLFHTLALTEYTKDTLVVIGVMFLQLCLTFVVGFGIKKLIPSSGAFLPYLVSSFEGGMLGYPLYTVLCGEERLSNIATLDIANTMFVFTIFIALLMAELSGNFRLDKMVENVLHSPVFWGVFLGIVVGLTGILKNGIGTVWGQVYQASESMLTSALSACILIVVGYGMSMKKSVLMECGYAVIFRFLIQAVFLVVTMFLLRNILITKEMKVALVLYSMLPSTFVVPVYAKTERESTYLSTTISMYSIVTILVFVVMSMLV